MRTKPDVKRATYRRSIFGLTAKWKHVIFVRVELHIEKNGASCEHHSTAYLAERGRRPLREICRSRRVCSGKHSSLGTDFSAGTEHNSNSRAPPLSLKQSRMSVQSLACSDPLKRPRQSAVSIFSMVESLAVLNFTFNKEGPRL